MPAAVLSGALTAFCMRMGVWNLLGTFCATQITNLSSTCASQALRQIHYCRSSEVVSSIASIILSEVCACQAGCAIADIVTTEHVRFAIVGDTDPNALLFAALQDRKVQISPFVSLKSFI